MFLVSLVLCSFPRLQLPAQEKEKRTPAKPDQKAEKRRPAGASFELAKKAGEELLDLKRKTRALEAEAIGRRRAAEERLRELAAEKDALGRSVESLKREVAGREKDLSEKKEALGAREKEAAALQHEVSTLSEPLKQFLDRVEKLVEEGIPWKVEPRLAAVRRARDDVSREGSGPAAGLQTVARLAEDEEALGRAIEAGTVEVEDRGERRAVQALHLGHLLVVFASDDGALSGCALPGQKIEDAARAPGKTPTMAREYLKAIEVLRRRRPPCLVDLHVPALPGESEEGQ